MHWKESDEETEQAYYIEPAAGNFCADCEWYRYDNGVYDERWCGRESPPNGLCSRRLIGLWGSCEWFQLAEHRKTPNERTL